MKNCELCNSPAKLFCESDQASLCWKCDAKVHSANFLVTKHSRILLCHICQSLTPWHGSGPKFVPTISICDLCISDSNEFCDDDDDDEDDDDTDNDDVGEEDDEEEENQVVPWTSTPPPPPPPVSSSSESSGSSKVDDSEEGV